jgi:phosphoribosylformylglycinamidine synthase
MLSESQERMLVIVKPQHEGDVRALFERWELHCATIGVVTDDGPRGGIIRVRDGGVEVARVSAKLLVDAPAYTREVRKPEWLTAVQDYDLAQVPDAGEGAYNGSELSTMTSDLLLELLASPEIASKRIVWRQYDHQVGTNTVVGPGSDAAVIRIKDTNKALAIATDGNAAYTYLDPYMGGAIAVAEAARNVVCAGAKPIGMTNCLNFGNPEKADVYYQLSEAVRGMADAARALGIPVISGNVSLYNETNGEAIWPTPVVGVVGLIDDVSRTVPSGFQDDGDVVFIAGRVPDTDRHAGSQLHQQRGLVAGHPSIDLGAEARLQAFLVEAGASGLLKSAHDVSGGGLLVAIAECAIAGGIGLEFEHDLPEFSALSEPQSLAVITCAPIDLDLMVEAAERSGVPVESIGLVGGTHVRGARLNVAVDDLRDAYESGLPAALTAPVPALS